MGKAGFSEICWWYTSSGAISSSFFVGNTRIDGKWLKTSVHPNNFASGNILLNTENIQFLITNKEFEFHITFYLLQYNHFREGFWFSFLHLKIRIYFCIFSLGVQIFPVFMDDYSYFPVNELVKWLTFEFSGCSEDIMQLSCCTILAQLAYIISWDFITVLLWEESSLCLW